MSKFINLGLTWLVAITLVCTSSLFYFAGETCGAVFPSKNIIIIGEEIYVPLNSGFSQLEYTVIWDKSTKTILLDKGLKTIELAVNVKTSFVNRMEYELRFPVVIENNIAYMELETFTDLTSMTVQWEKELSQLALTPKTIEKDELDNALVDIPQLRKNVFFAKKYKESEILNHPSKITPSRGGQVNYPMVLNLDLSKDSTVTAQQIDNFLKGTDLADTGKYFIEAEESHRVNAVFLVALACLESGYGSSLLAKNKNNIFGFRAYDGSSYVSAKAFASKRDCILQVAKYISKEYLTSGGKYYAGNDLLSVNRNYSRSGSWAGKVASLMLELDKSN